MQVLVKRYIFISKAKLNVATSFHNTSVADKWKLIILGSKKKAFERIKSADMEEGKAYLIALQSQRSHLDNYIQQIIADLYSRDMVNPFLSLCYPMAIKMLMIFYTSIIFVP